MADAQSVFLLALASARRRSYQHALSIAPGRCVFARGNTQRQLVVSLLPEPGFLAKNQLPTQAPEWITVPMIAHLNPTEPERILCPVRQLKLYIRNSERIRGGRQRMFIHWNRSIRDIMRSHIWMDRGDCQGSLHSSWSSVWPCDSAWGPSALSFMGIQLSGGFTWHPVSDFLEVIWGLPELVPARHGLYCWGHVDTGSSGGRTTRRGSRTSSPTSIAYTICMQPLLRRS